MSAVEKEQPEAAKTRFAKDQLKAFVERIERLEEEKKTISDDIRDVYAESKGNGFDVKALRAVIRLRKQEPTSAGAAADPGHLHERARHAGGVRSLSSSDRLETGQSEIEAFRATAASVVIALASTSTGLNSQRAKRAFSANGTVASMPSLVAHAAVARRGHIRGRARPAA